MDVAVYCLLPTLGCVVAVWLLRRFAPAAGDVGPVSDSIGVPARAKSRALPVVASILMLLVGAFVGMWITSTVQIQQMSGWMVATIDSARRSQYAFAQYREANYEEAKSALEHSPHTSKIRNLLPENGNLAKHHLATRRAFRSTGY